jgi:PAS domain S-box-containing protein
MTQGDRERTEEALRESEERYRRLMEAARDAIFIADVETGRIVDCNARAGELLGMPVAKILGVHHTELHPPSDRAQCRQHFLDDVRRGGSAGTEMPVQRADGSILWVEVSASVYEAGGRRLIQGTFRDITERRAAEEAVRTAEAKYRSLVDNLSSGVAVYEARRDGEDFVFVDFNRGAERIDDVPRERVLGRSVLEVFPGVKAFGVFDVFQRVWRTGRPEHLPAAVYHDGRIRGWRENYVYKLPTGEIVAVYDDVTALREAEARLRQAQKMEAVGRLAGGIAHDFNNLLTVIKGYCDMLLRPSAPDSPAAEPLRQILSAAGQAADLTNQLLAFSRQQVLSPRLMNLNDLLADMAGPLQRLLGDRVRLSLVQAPDLTPIRADPTQVRQAILNLAANARDAMPDGGALTVETANVDLDAAHAEQHPGAAPGPHVMLAVSDTGTGMDEETRQRVFEPFFTTKPSGRGTGLGLAIVYGFVKQSGGHVHLTSAPGEGTTLRIYLPRAAADAEAATPQPPPAEAVPRGTETVLLVEDDETVRAFVARVLREAGHPVLEATSPQDALRLARNPSTPFDLLISDVRMPGMSGPDLVREIRAARPDAPVLYITGYADRLLGGPGGPDGDADVLVKPFTPAALAAAVRRALAAAPRAES